MILVDTSVWIDHLHSAEPALVELLGRDEVGCHRLVIEELALGAIKRRAAVLQLLGQLRAFPDLTHSEALNLIDDKRLWGQGLSAVDVHLVGSVVLVPGAKLWTREERLLAVSRKAGVEFRDNV
jgi:predicted nucleic acid-binding protein